MELLQDSEGYGELLLSPLSCMATPPSTGHPQLHQLLCLHDHLSCLLAPPAPLKVEPALPPSDSPASRALPASPLLIAPPPAQAVLAVHTMMAAPPLPAWSSPSLASAPPERTPSSPPPSKPQPECHIKKAGTCVSTVKNTIIIKAIFTAGFVTSNNLPLRLPATFSVFPLCLSAE